ncbi:orotate phosphoribosyltransferase [Paenibacillus darwinianus]|uniref:Orotate phosphoribosyltransferase n=1 Tax=Paenibacillus darwinianus TaxID=1380763 RepID=A0A9W5S4B8_9BACL|nr:orotate phosphoribosyltransferase [Paenibacillus darwinianus]EXX91617.1 orotate phosphoribosyltransferase [Paenibacillus darwinianus]EXX92599.1 orotate phosphoribosyltransferase [Paenibacillus darwinianus]EXX92664.1 orotate phosphoribosyltransferase [Paenibacillus darwinianus]
MLEAGLNKLPGRIAEHLLNIGAVALRPTDPFTWSSGMKSPIYCDNRLTMSYPEVRDTIAEGFAAVIRDRFPDCEAVAGIATGGIPHAAWVAQKLGLPMLYVRDKAKGHGKTNLIEGCYTAGQKVVLIEDLVSTGGSSLKAAVAVREAGCEVLGTVAIFTYEFPQAAAAFEEQHIPLHTLSNYTALIDTALSLGKIRKEDVALLKSWREDPQSFGQ